MKKLFVLICILTAITGKSFAYYTVEQIKYEQSLGKTDTLNRAMENHNSLKKCTVTITTNKIMRIIKITTIAQTTHRKDLCISLVIHTNCKYKI